MGTNPDMRCVRVHELKAEHAAAEAACPIDGLAVSSYRRMRFLDRLGQHVTEPEFESGQSYWQPPSRNIGSSARTASSNTARLCAMGWPNRDADILPVRAQKFIDPGMRSIGPVAHAA